jgi:hypothetical protein
VKRLICSPVPARNWAAVFGVSFTTGAVGLLLFAYCLYVSWYGRWGLPKLKRVSERMNYLYVFYLSIYVFYLSICML